MKQLAVNHYLAIFGINFLFGLGEGTNISQVCETNDDHQYFFDSNKNYTWFEALQNCASRNMTLATIDTEEKNSYLVKLLREKSDGTFFDLWIGAAESTPGKFVWASNGKSVDFNNWEAGEPNGEYGYEPCVHTWAQTANLNWADSPCYAKYGYLCEKTFASEFPSLLKDSHKKVDDKMDELTSHVKETCPRENAYEKVTETKEAIHLILKKLQ